MESPNGAAPALDALPGMIGSAVNSSYSAFRGGFYIVGRGL
jgi:hypothetical protein